MKIKNGILLVLFAGLLGSCAPVIVGRGPVPGPGRGEGRGSWSLHTLGIPPGHMPPPGSCRVWYPGRPPGHQPPPFKCGIGRLSVPLGAFLVQRLDGEHVQVDEYDARRPNYVLRSATFAFNDDERGPQGRGHGKEREKGKGRGRGRD